MSSSNPFTAGLGRHLEPPVELDGPAIFRALGLMTQPNASVVEQALGLPIMSNRLIGDALWRAEAVRQERLRRRADWNARFEHWERPASSSEENTLDRAQRMVKDAISDGVWLGIQRATVERQGSYYNNTNTRRDADVDLRVQLPIIKIDYNPNVSVGPQHRAANYGESGWTCEQLFTMMRWELETCLGEAFGKKNVVAGKKAFRVKGMTGSRAEVDVVPALLYHHVWWWEAAARFETTVGVAILSTDGMWTYNYPEAHLANGVAKRARTARQFKRVVRIFKRLRADLAAHGLLHAPVPSFLVESLIYNVEDGFFTVAGDDRYARVRRVAQRLQWMLHDEPSAAAMVEANGIKQLFTLEQGWSWAGAKAFANSVVAHLGDA